MDQAIGNPQRDADLHGTALHVFLRAVEYTWLRAHSPGGGSGGLRAGAKRGGVVGSPRWEEDVAEGGRVGD